MKTILSIVATAGLLSMAACNTTAVKEKEMAIYAQQRVIDSMRTEMARQQLIDSMNEFHAMQYSLQPTVIPAPREAAPVYYANQNRRRSYAGQSRQARTNTQPAPAPVVLQQAPVPAKKKGWSAKAKGAVIGAGTGAIAGAVINKRNRPVGALIGGVLGAGAGTGIGAILDKRNGR